MSQSPNQKNPVWFWLAWIPIFGGIAIAYAGQKINNNYWIALGIGAVISCLVLSSSPLTMMIWMAQICSSFHLKNQISSQKVINYSRSSNRKKASLRGNSQVKIDINTCSKDELVYELGLPIVYANDIESVRREGYIFTHVEELSEIAGLPENYITQISAFVTFSYDINKELDVSWRRLNSYSHDELIECGLDSKIAKIIIKERKKKGAYKSVIDVQRRTGIPLSYYHHLI